MALGALLKEEKILALYQNGIFVQYLSIVSVSVFMNLSEQTHLPEVVVSLLQSGELSQETLILPPLLIQLCPQSCTHLRHSLVHTLCTQTKKNTERKKTKGLPMK